MSATQTTQALPFANIEAGSLFYFCGMMWEKKGDGLAAPLRIEEDEMAEDYEFEPQTLIESLAKNY